MKLLENPLKILTDVDTAYSKGSADFERDMQYIDPVAISMLSYINSQAAQARQVLETFAKGGAGMAGLGITAEGGELMEDGVGNISKISGPSHENGGVPIVLPDGGKIYSDRVKIGGETISKRKEKRAMQLKALERKLEKRPFDKALQNAYKRLKEIDEEETKKELAVQGMLRQIALNGDSPATQSTSSENAGQLPMYGLGSGPPEEELIPGDNYLLLPTPDLSSLFDGHGILDSQPHSKSSSTPTYGVMNDVTVGDILGIAGQAFGVMKPFSILERDRAGDKATPNFFNDYGKSGLNKMEESKRSLVAYGSSEKTKADDMARQLIDNATRTTNSGATGVANMLAAYSKAGDYKNKISASLLGMLANTDKNIATMLNNRDKMVMTGEQFAYMTDEKNRDNYFTELAKAWANASTGLQHIGKNINQAKQRNVTTQLVNDMSKYFTYDPISGKFSRKDGVDPVGTMKYEKMLNGEDKEFLKQIGVSLKQWLALKPEERMKYVINYGR